MSKVITKKQYDSYAKRIEKENLKKNGCSLTWVSILGHSKAILEVESSTNTLIVKDNWKEILTQAGKIVQ